MVVEREVDASVQAGDRRLGRRRIEGAERARLLGRHQAVVGVRGVREALIPNMSVRTRAAAPDCVECPEV